MRSLIKTVLTGFVVLAASYGALLIIAAMFQLPPSNDAAASSSTLAADQLQAQAAVLAPPGR